MTTERRCCEKWIVRGHGTTHLNDRYPFRGIRRQGCRQLTGRLFELFQVRLRLIHLEQLQLEINSGRFADNRGRQHLLSLITVAVGEIDVRLRNRIGGRLTAIRRRVT
ncbi:MAG TPA: hypothetical protein DCF72_13245 [Gammaproteobacteria bacterium]|nr:hypothetical protein [Gammaproteobacteria bacterium]